jgi:hypothetical protein
LSALRSKATSTLGVRTLVLLTPLV